jgi:peptidoglycan hydrolase-like protein with peptidoglycan-binding domain
VAQTTQSAKATTTTSTPKKATSHSKSAKTPTAAHASSSKSSSTSAKSTKKGSAGKFSRTKKVKGQATPSPERITQIQDALASRGAFTGITSGKLDDDTADALRKFQSANHLTPTGKIDALTLQKLGLGSETAGLAAPTPPPNSTANRLLSRTTHPDPNDNN